MSLKFFHPPTNSHVPKDWFTTQAQRDYVQFLAPYYTVARRAGLQEQFLEALYLIWFDRFPVDVESEDPYDISWATDVEQDRVANELLHLSKGLFWTEPAWKTVLRTDRCWEDILNLEADRASRRAKYYACRKLGIHLNEYQYLVAVDIEEDRIPVSGEENMNSWVKAMALDANIFDTDT